MNTDSFKWYDEIGFPNTVISKALEVISKVEELYTMQFDDVFISNIQNDGHEDYPSLWLFTDQDVVECKFFLTRFDIDIAKYKGNVRYVNIMANSSEDLIKPNSSSAMKLSVSLVDEVRCNFDAVGQNCLKLGEIAKRYLEEYKSRK